MDLLTTLFGPEWYNLHVGMPQVKKSKDNNMQGLFLSTCFLVCFLFIYLFLLDFFTKSKPWNIFTFKIVGNWEFTYKC